MTLQATTLPKEESSVDKNRRIPPVPQELGEIPMVPLKWWAPGRDGVDVPLDVKEVDGFQW